MNVYKFYIKKDYDQLRKRTIAETSFNLKIVDHEFQADERVKMIIKEENDNDMNVIEFYLRKNINNQFIVDFPFNKRGTFIFTLQIENRSGDIIEQSAVNSFVYDGTIYNQELIVGSAEWGVIQSLLKSLHEPKEFVQKELESVINNTDFATVVNEFVERKEGEVNEFIEGKEEEVNDFVEEKTKQINNHLKDIDDYLDKSQDKIDTLLTDINELLNIFLEEGEE